MKVTLVLGDYAKVADGKLDLLGGGWIYAGPGPSTMGIGIIIEVPWDQANKRHTLSLKLLSADGDPVQLPNPFGPPGPLEINSEFEVGRPPGHTSGTPIPFALAINLNGLPLPPGSRYSWRLEIDDTGREDWHLSFQTREVPPRAVTPPFDVPPGP